MATMSERVGAGEPSDMATTTARRPVLGVLSIATPVVMGGFFLLLALTFDYPAIMDKAPAEVLTAVVDGGGSVRLWWAGVMVGALLLAVLSVHLPLATSGGSAVKASIAAAGVGAAALMLIDLSQWVTLYPDLADRYVRAAGDAGLRAAIERDYTDYHEVLGELLGRYVATFLSGLWAVGTGMLMARCARWPRLLGWAGIVSGVALLISGIPGLSFATWGVLNSVGFVIWFVWLIATGLVALGYWARRGGGDYGSTATGGSLWLNRS